MIWDETAVAATASRFGASRLLWLAVICLVAALFSGCGAALEDALIDRSNAWPLRTAESWNSPSIAWTPPFSLEASGDGVLDEKTPWQTVDLPHQVPTRFDAPPPADEPNVRWYRLRVREEASPPIGTRTILYLPRWNVRGTVAVYADGYLVWHTAGGRQWNGFYTPLWIDLEWASSPVHDIYVRMAALPDYGSTLSTVWLGGPEALALSWHTRYAVQVGLISWTSNAYWIVGLLAVIGWWLQRPRRGRTQLWFAAMALFAPVPFFVYLMNDRSLWLPENFLTWTFYSGTLALIIFVLYFLANLLRFHMPRLQALCVGYNVLAMAAIGLTLALAAPEVPPQVLARELTYWLLPAWMMFLVYILYAAWRLRTGLTIMLLVINLLSIPALVHDLVVQVHQGGAEHMLISPFIFPVALLVYLYAVLRRYLAAVEQARHTSYKQQQALLVQEKALGETHARLMQARQTQILAVERQRLMQEMHDGIGASLLSALYYLRYGKTSVNDAMQTLQECIDDLKLSIDSLEPSDGDLLQLLSSLRFRLSPRLQGAGIDFHWRVVDLPLLPWLDAQSGMHVLRVLQEILTNILKHAEASSVTLSTAVGERDGEPGVIVEVIDDGRPFNPPPPESLQPGRKGLGNVKSRVQLLGGYCAWTSLPKGNCFTLWLSLIDKPVRGLLAQ